MHKKKETIKLYIILFNPENKKLRVCVCVCVCVCVQQVITFQEKYKKRNLQFKHKINEI